MKTIIIILAGIAGVVVVRLVLKLTYVSAVKLFTKLYNLIKGFLSSNQQQSKEKQ